jgi:hypothetical protein
MKKPREKCIGRTKGSFHGTYPCALYAMEGSQCCRFHDHKMLDAKEDARLAKAEAQIEQQRSRS